MSNPTSEYLDAIEHLPDGATLVLREFSWEDYERLLKNLGDRPGIRVSYDEGRLEIMSPLPEHEEYKRLIERIVDGLGDHLDVNVEPRGSATWKRKRDQKGTEPDTCYYVANAERQGFRPVRKGELARLAPLTGDAAFARDGGGFAHLRGDGKTHVEVIADGPPLPSTAYGIPRAGCPSASAVAAELPNTGSEPGWAAAAGALVLLSGIALRLLAPN